MSRHYLKKYSPVLKRDIPANTKKTGVEKPTLVSR